MATAGLADIQGDSWGCAMMKPRIATGWRSPPDPTDKQSDGEDQVVAPGSGSGAGVRLR